MTDDARREGERIADEIQSVAGEFAQETPMHDQLDSLADQVRALTSRPREGCEHRWQEACEHPDLFEDGERMLVAVALADGTYDYDVISFMVDGDEDGGYCRIKCNGESWGWAWEDVTHWMRIPALAAQEPQA